MCKELQGKQQLAPASTSMRLIMLVEDLNKQSKKAYQDSIHSEAEGSIIPLRAASG